MVSLKNKEDIAVSRMSGRRVKLRFVEKGKWELTCLGHNVKHFVETKRDGQKARYDSRKWCHRCDGRILEGRPIPERIPCDHPRLDGRLCPNRSHWEVTVPNSGLDKAVKNVCGSHSRNVIRAGGKCQPLKKEKKEEDE